MTDSVEFGFPEFARTIFAEHGPALILAHEHSHLANKMIGALPTHMTRDQVVINMLVRMTTTGRIELLSMSFRGGTDCPAARMRTQQLIIQEL